MDKPVNILLVAPVSDYKAYILPQWINFIKRQLTFKNYDILLVDNSTDISFHRKLRRLNVDVYHRAPRKNEKRLNEVITACNNFLLDYFLEHTQYTHIFSLECDVFPPTDVIQRLLAHNKPVVSGLYFIGNSWNTKPMLQTVNPFKNIVNVNLKTGFSVTAPGLLQIFGTGKGCLLIQRHVFEQTNIKFRVDPLLNVHDDTFLMHDLRRAGVPVYVDTSIICKHYNSDWKQINNHFKNKVR